jgi:aldehyde dehydrogenase (NAD+)
MTRIDHIYIDGEFVVPHGEELFDLHDPTAGAVIGQVRLGDAEDARAAVRAGKAAAWAMAQTSKAKRLEMLGSLSDAVAERRADLIEAIMLEFGAPRALAGWMADGAAGAFRAAAESLRDYPLTQIVGAARVVMAPVGVAGLITPWNANPLFICNKLAYALAAGCPAVIKPSEMSAIQTEVVVRALDRARLPRGSFNVVNGRGDVVGHEIVVSPDVSKISFTGSTTVGKQILRSAADTLKRVTLELGGKSPTIVLDDADLETAVDGVIGAGFINTGQACIAGTRVLVSARRQAEFEAKLVAGGGDPRTVGAARPS